MLSITVKTLDSQNHHYRVEEDMTVKQFKEKIAAEVDIPASRQRLIYCGRVLQDDKPLKDYNVHEKAVHLVARPPPQPSGQQQQQQSQRQPSSGRSLHFPPPPLVRPGPNSSTVRMNNARQFLQNVSTVLEQIDNQRENGSTTEAAAAPQTETSASEASQSTESSRVSPQPDDRTPNATNSTEDGASPLSQLAQVAQQAVMSAAMSAARSIGSIGNNIFMQIDEAESVPQMGMVQFDVGVGIERPGGSTQNDSSSSTTENPPETAAPQPPQTSTSDPPPAQEAPTPPQRPPRPRTSAMVEVLDDLLRVTQQIQPYIERCRRYLHEDQDFTNNEEAANNAQRCYNRVCEALHLMAHAQHAISDLDVDFHSAPPRHLRSQYIVLSQPTAILQAGVPMQINVTTSTTINRGDRGQPTSEASTSQPSASRPDQSSATTTTTTTTASSSSEAAANKRSESSRTTAAATTTTTSTTSTSGSRTGGFPQHLFFGGPGQANHGHVIVGNTVPGEFMQDMMSAIVQHYNSAPPTCGTIEVRLSSSPPTNQTASTSQARSGNPNSQNSQARVNTATNPTMSTQTRSTSRPHVHHHFHPMPSPITPGGSSFDVFLPCNSHHVRRGVRHVIRTHAQSRSENGPRTASDSSGERRSTPLTLFRQFLQFERLFGSNEPLLGGGSTLLDVLRTHTNFPCEQRQQSLATDLIVLSAANLSINDVLEPPFLFRLQEWLRDFVSRRVMMGREPTEENLETGALLILDSLNPQAIQTGMQVRGSIDFVASVKNLLKEKIIEFLKVLTQKEPLDDNRFEDSMTSLMSDTVSDLIILYMLCHQDRRGAIRQIIRTNLRRVSPTIVEGVFTLAMERVRARMRNLTEDRVQSYVIRLPEPKTTQTLGRIQVPEPMETDVDENDTSWHGVVPPEWIPVITADVGRQRRMPSQPEPFSDAYIAGMPCKRRRISRQGQNTQELLSESLRRALNVSGVTSISGNTNLLEDVRQDRVLGAAFREHLRGELDERVRNDPDYSSERFPNTHAFMKR